MTPVNDSPQNIVVYKVHGNGSAARAEAEANSEPKIFQHVYVYVQHDVVIIKDAGSKKISGIFSLREYFFLSK